MRGLKKGSTGTDYPRTVSTYRQRAKQLGRTQTIRLGLVARTFVKVVYHTSQRKKHDISNKGVYVLRKTAYSHLR